MSANFRKIEHIFIDVSKKIKKVFPDLTIMWLPHEPNKRKEAITPVEHKFTIHPAGTMMLAELDNIPDNQRFSGIACAKEKGKGLFSGGHALACFFVDISEIVDENTALHLAYMDVYQVLSTLNPYKDLGRSLDIPSKKFIPAPDAASNDVSITDHLGGDVFSALVLYFEGMKQSTYYLARLRTKEVFSTNKGAKPENKIFPIVAESLRLLIAEYTQSVDFKKTGQSPLFPAFSMTCEIIDTFPIQTAKSWQMFCRRAQVLAWAGHDTETILGAAVYYTEDAFIRTDAHLACDILQKRPLLMTRLDFYNAFADDEFNERRHFKMAQEYFEMLIMKASVQNNIKLFTERIHRQNESFLLGTVMGWCVPSLIAAMEPLKQSYSIENARESHRIFKEHLSQTSWASIKAATHILFEVRRSFGKISEQEAVEILQKHPKLEAISKAFSF